LNNDFSLFAVMMLFVTLWTEVGLISVLVTLNLADINLEVCPVFIALLP
jgi:hypothetical protein